MKEYYESFESKADQNRVSVFTNKGLVVVGVDIGVDGFEAQLNSKEVKQLISMLKSASKKANNVE
jgi:sRNA-binding regulator protein Hfq